MMKLAKNLLWYGVITASRLPSQDGLQHKAGHEADRQILADRRQVGHASDCQLCVCLCAERKMKQMNTQSTHFSWKWALD